MSSNLSEIRSHDWATQANTMATAIMIHITGTLPIYPATAVNTAEPTGQI